MIASLGDRRPVFQGAGHFIAHNATIIGSVRLHAGVSVWYNAVLRGDNDWIEVGENSNIQDASVLHTDAGIALTVGSNVTIGHCVMLHGCKIGDGSLIGIGSTILNKARIGRHCLVGAHTLVTEGKCFPDGVLILGSPAKVIRELDEQERKQLQVPAGIYADNGQRFSSELAECEPKTG
ncbi:MAG: gamma carbonic anhydrase family protein [Gammaproteobacteria bacterium]|nr:gamma carbonic anhydrase family protein [Gammaproteobacteria bacterium]MDH4313835.1 gamma carbonic anhydrase family protein [Gammaproteobacteria bacterium]MDH5213687.1 gamma carbonic anhydrase family protein [Gammaproteobacteria bacterium]MDH5499673.1 gamma carbonic anhydrase family protein [Gammaproteobacteria bacterium]